MLLAEWQPGEVDSIPFAGERGSVLEWVRIANGSSKRNRKNHGTSFGKTEFAVRKNFNWDDLTTRGQQEELR
jgi:hypothetical protein